MALACLRSSAPPIAFLAVCSRIDRQGGVVAGGDHYEGSESEFLRGWYP
jgi:hypothetical protein